MSKLNDMLQMDKVSRIEFHITETELEDFIVRSAELIKEGYKLYSIIRDSNIHTYADTCDVREPYLHIVFARNRWE